jgi:hypothetical protein
MNDLNLKFEIRHKAYCDIMKAMQKKYNWLVLPYTNHISVVDALRIKSTIKKDIDNKEQNNG